MLQGRGNDLVHLALQKRGSIPLTRCQEMKQHQEITNRGVKEERDETLAAGAEGKDCSFPSVSIFAVLALSLRQEGIAWLP